MANWKSYCESKGYGFVENSNIDGGLLNRSKLHLNKKGTALLSRNIANVDLIVMVILSVPKFLVIMKCLAWTT